MPSDQLWFTLSRRNRSPASTLVFGSAGDGAGAVVDAPPSVAATVV
jgi:hypothetical protein